MGFFRIKKVKGREYGYIVENTWSKKGSRQKVMGYIGRVYRFSLVKNIDFFKYLNIENFQDYIEKNDKNKIIWDLVGWELHKFDVSSEIFTIDLGSKTIQKNKKNVILLINEGFLCSLTLANLLDFNPGRVEEIDGFNFARAFVETGIKVPNEIFVGLFGKLYIKQN